MSSAQVKKTDKKSAKVEVSKPEVAKEVKTEVTKEVKEVKVAKEKKASVKKEVVAEVVSVVEEKKEKRTRKPREEKPKAESDETEEKEVVKRAPATNESVMTEVLDLIAGLSTASLSELKDQKQSLKKLKNTASRLKHLRNDLSRVLKKSNRSTAPKDKSKLSNSGLMKPVVISKELAEFMKVPADSLHSRVSVTNAICSYIKENNLQNPSNKREITADAALARILKFSPGAQPLTYFYIQQLIQPHFLKEVSPELAAFMKVSPSSLQSSSTVSAALLAYANSKSLVQGTNVTPDEDLSKLLGKSSTMTVQAMNQLVKSHFKK